MSYDSLDTIPVTLDVEGRLFKTELRTLKRIPNSFFCDLLELASADKNNDEAAFFIDRDSEMFQLVLGYMRDGRDFPLPTDGYILDRLEHEARFYRLPELVDNIERQRSYSKLPLRKSNSNEPPDSPPPPPPTQPNANKREKAVNRSKLANKVKEGEKRRDSKNKLEKADIGEPREFVHVVHVGWNSESKCDAKVVNNRHIKIDSTVEAVLNALGYGRSTASASSASTPPRIGSTEGGGTSEPIYSLVDGQGEGAKEYHVIFKEATIASPRSQDSRPHEIRLADEDDIPPRYEPVRQIGKFPVPPTPPDASSKPKATARSLFKNNSTENVNAPEPLVRLAKYEKMTDL